MAMVDVSKLTFEVTDRIREYLFKLIEMGGSDLHVKAGAPLMARIRGEITRMSDDEFSRGDALTLAKEMLRTRFEELVEEKQADFSFTLNDDYRFRGNIFFQKDGVSAVFRVIPTKVLSLEELNMPHSIEKIVSAKRGIVLVTGATGSGKSTTMAAIIDAVNSRFPRHILTIEDPIEFIHADKRSIINQRSVGVDALDFPSALKSALREDPDVILIGEIRDIETMEIALHAAETGHLVLSTMHTIDATETVNRVIGMYPSGEQNRVRLAIASVLQGVVSQRLVRTKEGGRVAALEILLQTERISELIRKNRDDEIKTALEDGRTVYGTQTFDDHLYELFMAEKIEEDEALASATSPDNLKLRIQGVGGASGEWSGGMAPEEDVIKLKKF